MYIYNPSNEPLIENRLKQAESILKKIQIKHCFITGSFLYKKDAKDIDIFIISRSRKKISIQGASVTRIDFNDMYSLFFHSISKTCVSKNPLPCKPVKVTMSDYWSVINEAIPTILNNKDNFRKEIRFLVLYTEYLKNNIILDTFGLKKKIDSFRDYQEVLDYIDAEAPPIINKNNKPSYIKRMYYSLSRFYDEVDEYYSENLLKKLALSVVRASRDASKISSQSP